MNAMLTLLLVGVTTSGSNEPLACPGFEVSGEVIDKAPDVTLPLGARVAGISRAGWRDCPPDHCSLSARRHGTSTRVGPVSAFDGEGASEDVTAGLALPRRARKHGNECFQPSINFRIDHQ
jgi:hypothetical protein